MDGVLTTLIMFGTTFLSAPGESSWMNDYGKALEKTRAARQPLLIVLDVPHESSQRIEQVTYSSDTTSRQLLQPYVLCHVDVTTWYGKKVAEAFRVTEFPHTAIIDETGKKIIYSKTGTFTVKDWVNTLISHRDGQIPRARSFPLRVSNSTYGAFQSRICFT